MKTSGKTFSIGKVFIFIGLGIYTIFVMFPIYWTINTSFKDINDVYSVPPSFFPPKPTCYLSKWRNKWLI